ncbi:MAG: CBS domain-containing protein [Candidatus Diapherotrites archaeon]
MKRLRLGLTQQELSRLSSVSQSLIAKIEKGTTIPSYDNAKRLFEALSKLHEQKSLAAKDAMTKKIVFVGENDSVDKAIALIEKHGFSQLPVLKDGKSVGSVTEELLLKKMNSFKGHESKLKVKEIMAESMPIVQPNTPFNAVSVLLNYSNGVLVQFKGKVKGIITRTDVLKSLA